MKRAVLTLTFFALILPSFASVIPQPCLKALQRALSSSAEWTMQRSIADTGRVFVSTGVVDCVAGKGIDWKVLYPFESSVSMTTNKMIFCDEEGTRVKKLSELPHYARICSLADDFLSGKGDAFKEVFDCEVRMSQDGRWSILMSPRIQAMRRLFDSIVLEGSDRLSSAVFLASRVSKTTIHFKEIVREK
jgi:hypothetical protein